jgi:DNA-binding NtrC family response regulator
MISKSGQREEKDLHHILLVDDEEAVLAALRDTLAAEGYRVTTAPNAMQALARLRERAYSVVVTDQRMPMMSGLEFLAQVREIQPDATRILITAVLSLDVVIDAINKGEIYRFIVKPWLREELLVTIHNAVQRFELISRNATLQATLLATNAKLTELNTRLEGQVALGLEQNKRLETLTAALEQNLHQSLELCLKDDGDVLSDAGTSGASCSRAVPLHGGRPPVRCSRTANSGD